jgi:replicative DNA helicase
MFTETVQVLEQSLLAYALLDPKGQTWVADQCAATDWSDPRHRALYKAIARNEEQGNQPDLVLLKATLEERGELDLVGGYPYITSLLIQESPTIHLNCTAYLDRMRGEAYRRSLQTNIQQLLQNLEESTEEPHVLLELFQSEAQTLAPPSTDPEDTAPTFSEIALGDYEDAKSHRLSGHAFAGLDTGFKGLNERLNGLCPGELSVLAGRPGLGKSALSRQVLLHIAKQGYRVGLISLEMTPGQIIMLMGSLTAGVAPMDVRRGMLNEDDEERYRSSLAWIDSLDIELVTGVSTIKQIASVMDTAEAHQHVDLWVVDHLHRFSFDTDRAVSQLGDITHRLADIALTHRTHVLLLAQLSRKVEARADKRPQLADLRDSGQIEEHAVNCMMIYRPSAYQELQHSLDASNPHQTWIDCPKVRFGINEPIELAWRPEAVAFDNPPEIRYVPHIEGAA